MEKNTKKVKIWVNMASEAALPWQHTVDVNLFQNLVPQHILVKVATFGWYYFNIKKSSRKLKLARALPPPPPHPPKAEWS